jgi:hypothetical protein
MSTFEKPLAPTGTARQRPSGNRMSRKFNPYGSEVLPLEVRYASRFMSRGYQPDFLPEAMHKVCFVCYHVSFLCTKTIYEKLEEQLEKGLSQMKTSTLYKGYKAKLLSREVARQRLFLSTLEAEEADLTATYADSICAENRERFGLAEEELQRYRKRFSQRGCLDAVDRDYLQAVYEDECQILRTISVQTDQVAKILDKRIAQSLTNSTGYLPTRRRFRKEVHIAEPYAHEDSDVTSDGSDDAKVERLGLSDDGTDE